MKHRTYELYEIRENFGRDGDRLLEFSASYDHACKRFHVHATDIQTTKKDIYLVRVQVLAKVTLE